MSSIRIKDGAGNDKYLLEGTGNSGDTDGASYTPVHEAIQATHNDLNCNANIQVGDSDVSTSNAVPIKNDTGNLGVAIRSDILLDGSTELDPLFAVVNLSANGPVVGAVSGKKIRVLAYVVVNTSGTDATIFWTSGDGGADLTGRMILSASGGGGSSPYCPLGLFETASGVELYLDTGGSNIDGHITYTAV